MASIAVINATIAQNATEDSSGSKADGKRDLGRASKDRGELKAEMARRQKEAAELQEKYYETQDKDFWDDVCGFLFGDDNGAGDVMEAQGVNAAELERATNELKLLKAETSDVLDELQTADTQLDDSRAVIDEIQAGEDKAKNYTQIAY
jgi:hypothetical protein